MPKLVYYHFKGTTWILPILPSINLFIHMYFKNLLLLTTLTQLFLHYLFQRDTKPKTILYKGVIFGIDTEDNCEEIKEKKEKGLQPVASSTAGNKSEVCGFSIRNSTAMFCLFHLLIQELKAIRKKSFQADLLPNLVPMLA